MEKKVKNSVMPKTRRRGCLVFTMPSRTLQSERDNVNINTIVARARLGIAPVTKTGFYADTADGIDSYQEFLDIQNNAKGYFNALPAKTRLAFGNNMTNFIEALADPSNVEKLREMGIIPKAPKPRYAEDYVPPKADKKKVPEPSKKEAEKEAEK